MVRVTTISSGWTWTQTADAHVGLLDRDGETLEQFRVIAFTVVRHRRQHAGAGGESAAALLSVPGNEKSEIAGSRVPQALAKFQQPSSVADDE